MTTLLDAVESRTDLSVNDVDQLVALLGYRMREKTRAALKLKLSAIATARWYEKYSQVFKKNGEWYCIPGADIALIRALLIEG